MEERKVKLVIGALLHDIGKILYRYNDRRNHSTSGTDYLKTEIHIKDNEILEQVLYHHNDLLKSANIENNSLAYITYIADNIASATDRRKKENEEFGFSQRMPLESIFNLLNENEDTYVYQAQCLEKTINYPIEETNSFDKEFYGKIVNHLTESLLSIPIPYTSEYLNSLLEILETEWSYIPSSTSKSEVADVSLYDHVKLTAGFASCIMEWLEEQEISDYRQELLKHTNQFYKKEVFLLYSMDISGIQNFIYTIASKDALKSLRARSFYLELLMEDIIDELVEKVNVTRANLLYSGGGHAYLILPNTQKVKNILGEFEKNINDWFLEQFGTALYLGCGYCECNTLALHNEPSGAYRNIFKQVSTMISKKKMHRYSAKQIMDLNNKESKEQTRECTICRTSDRLNDENICKICDALIQMSKHILYKGFYGVTKRKDISPSLPLPFGKYLIAQSEIALLEKMRKEEILRIYVKNEAYTGFKVAKRLWVGDYTNGETFEELAKNSEGISRLAVLRADIDNLGNAFVNGFASKKHGEKYMTISRTATFSRKMSMFFKYHINSLLENGQYYIADNRKKGKREITIVYSGGDDVFIVGSWDEVIGFAIDLRESLQVFTQDTLTISAGIGIYPAKYPISTMARQTGELEESAKGYPSKNAVALFDKELVFSWEDLRQNVLEEKLKFLKQFFATVPDKGKAFLYRILELVRSAEEDKMNLARLAYLIARLEEDVSKKDMDIQKLSRKIYEWAKNPTERKTLIAAIYLYVYLVRESEG